MKRSAITFTGDELGGENVINRSTYIADLEHLFSDERSRSSMPQDQPVYSVQAWFPVKEGTSGGLFFGITRLQPGKVGNEYFMTRGHFHQIPDRGEYYWTIRGEGALILMDRSRNTRVERMHTGSLHYIPAHTAHRVANTGVDVLSFGACWPADAGYDYEEIVKKGFSGRLKEIDGEPQLITQG